MTGTRSECASCYGAASWSPTTRRIVDRGSVESTSRSTGIRRSHLWRDSSTWLQLTSYQPGNPPLPVVDAGLMKHRIRTVGHDDQEPGSFLGREQSQCLHLWCPCHAIEHHGRSSSQLGSGERTEE